VKTIKKAVVVLALASLGGCAVTQTDVNNRAQKMHRQISDQLATQANTPPAALVERVRGSYLGGESVPLAYDATLPAVFSDVTLAFPGRTNLATVGERITEVTKLPVRLRPDVFITAKSLVRTGLSQNQANGQVAPPPVINPALPLPLPMSSRAQGANGAGIAAQTFDDFDVRLPMDYSGSLSGYLDLICARLGINWEYKDGTIILYRMVTKVLPIKVNPGSVDFASGLSKGGGGDKGSFTSSSSTNMKGDYNVCTTIESAVKSMLSPLGSSTVDQAGGLLVITDTKEVVDNVAHYIEVENSTLTRQVNISVRVVRVSITDSTEAGLDLNLIYKKLASGATDWTFGMQAPSTLTSSNAGSLDLNILKPNNRFQGSDVLVKALHDVGTVLSDDTTTANTTNRVPVPVGKFSTLTYLAETKPASGGGGNSGSGAGVPGLTPGTVTTGFFLNVLPTAFENSSVLLRVSLDQSVLTGIGSISTGSGETLQQINTPQVDGTKSDHSVGLRDGESMVLMGISSDGSKATGRASVTGFSAISSRTREVQLIILTPKVSAGI
jgi:type IVB pilus formation R64 PilN family outer membrane protein